MEKEKQHIGANELRGLLGERVLVTEKNEHQGKKGTIIAVRLTESGVYKKPLYVQFDSVCGVSGEKDFSLDGVKVLTKTTLYGYVDADFNLKRLAGILPEARALELGLSRAVQFDEMNEV